MIATPTVASAAFDAERELRTAGVDESRLEAELLLCHALGCSRTALLARLREPVEEDALTAYAAVLARRRGREPLAYITRECEFYGIAFACGPGALIPRPESELLVEVALDAARDRGAPTVADIGTGTGSIAVAVSIGAPHARVTAIDASPDALAIARRNVERHGLGDRVTLAAGDLLKGAGVFDIIVANLPYVREDEWPLLAPEVRDHEPREALVGGAAGTELIVRLLRQSPQHLAPGGVIAVEIGAGQTGEVAGVARATFPERTVGVLNDLARIERVVIVR